MLDGDPGPTGAPRRSPAWWPLALVAGLAYAWWPREGTYRPIQPYEGGTITQAGALLPGRLLRGCGAGPYGRITTGWAKGDARPTREHPQLALVLVPHGAAQARRETAPRPVQGTTAPQPWVFPFNKPLAPGEGDNQAHGGQHHRQHDPVRRRVRPGLGRRTTPRR